MFIFSAFFLEGKCFQCLFCVQKSAKITKRQQSFELDNFSLIHCDVIVDVTEHYFCSVLKLRLAVYEQETVGYLLADGR